MIKMKALSIRIIAIGLKGDGSVVALEEEVVRKQFGDKFVDDCK